MSTLSTYLAMSKPADGDTSWGTELRNAMDTLDQVVSAQYTYHVSSWFSDANLFPNGVPGTQRHFDTIQSALDEAAGSDTRLTICVWPGTYAETLSYTGRAHIQGMSMSVSDYVWGVEIQGDVTGPVIDWTPRNALVDTFAVRNCKLTQSGADPGSGQTWPFFVRINDQGVGNYGGGRNTVCFENVVFRVTSTPGSRTWSYGIASDGYTRVIFDRCVFRMSSNILNPIHVWGNNTTGVTAELHGRQNRVTYFAVSQPAINVNEGVSGSWAYNATQQDRSDLVTFGGTGTNTINGLTTDTEFTDYFNLAGDGLWY